MLRGIEAVIPTELEVPSLRRKAAWENETSNSEMIEGRFHFIEEIRKQAMIRIQRYQQSAAQHYNSKVKVMRLVEGHLVLRKIFQNIPELNVGKLVGNWGDPYWITRMV